MVLALAYPKQKLSKTFAELLHPAVEMWWVAATLSPLEKASPCYVSESLKSSFSG